MISGRTLLTATLQPRASRAPQPPHAAVAHQPDFDAAITTGACWVLGACAAWAALVVAAAGVELLSGGRTRALRWVAAPSWVRRLVLSLLGATLVGVPATAGLAAATPAGSAGPGTAPVTPVTRVTADGAAAPAGWGDAGGPDGLPLPSRPAVVAPPSGRLDQSGASGQSGTSSTSSTSGTTRTAGGRARAGAHVGLARVVVRPGDCLWDIAARRLPPGSTEAAVAAFVARTHALNRHLIGADPDLLRPGQRLVVPTGPSFSKPASPTARTAQTARHEETP